MHSKCTISMSDPEAPFDPGRSYSPIDCGIHDVLEYAFVRRIPLTLRFMDAEGPVVVSGYVMNVFQEGRAEYLRIAGLEEPVRLDQIRSIDAEIEVD